MEIIEVDLMHTDKDTKHPFLGFMTHCFNNWDDYYSKNNNNVGLNFLRKNKYYRWLTIKDSNINLRGKESGQQSLDYIYNNSVLVKSPNINLELYKDFENYLKNISKNIKRDYFRALNGEKNRDYKGKSNIIKVKNLYSNFLTENNLNDDIEKTINKWDKYRESRGSENIGFIRLIENLQKEHGLSPTLIKLSRYIRFKCEFKEFELIDYYNDLVNIININTKKKGIISGGGYDNWLKKVKYEKDNNNRKVIKDKYHCFRWFGVFDFDKLIGFISINIDGELAGVGYFFSDNNYFKYSITTFLLINVVKYLYNNTNVKCLNYWVNNCEGQRKMMKWKTRLGFKESCITVIKF